MTYALSRDDAGKFLPDYLERGILERRPVRLDRRGGHRRADAARLREAGAARGPKLKVGICGEHGGDPKSVRFCARARLRLRVVLAVPRAGRAARGGAGGGEQATRPRLRRRGAAMKASGHRGDWAGSRAGERVLRAALAFWCRLRARAVLAVNAARPGAGGPSPAQGVDARRLRRARGLLRARAAFYGRLALRRFNDRETFRTEACASTSAPSSAYRRLLRQPRPAPARRALRAEAAARRSRCSRCASRVRARPRRDVRIVGENGRPLRWTDVELTARTAGSASAAPGGSRPAESRADAASDRATVATAPTRSILVAARRVSVSPCERVVATAVACGQTYRPHWERNFTRAASS